MAHHPIPEEPLPNNEDGLEGSLPSEDQEQNPPDTK